MDKPSVKKEISELATSIKTQVDNFGERVSKPELDELVEKIGLLHKRCSVLEHMNADYNAGLAAKAADLAEEPKTEEPVITPPPPVEEEKPSESIITPAPQEEEPKKEEPIITPAPPVEEVAEKREPEPAPAPAESAKKMAIGINDKFQFIKELFAGDAEKYAAAITKLNMIAIPAEAELYFKSLQELNGWDEESATVQHLLNLMQKRFK